MLRLLRLAVLITSVLLAREELVRAGDQPKKEPVKIIVTAEKTPFTEDIKFAEKDCFIIMLPNGKAVALWAEKDRFAFGEQQTKSGLQCMWGEKPFALEPPKKDAYIEQGSVITSTRAQTTEHELFIGEWQLSYINDLASMPKLKVKIVVKKRERRKNEK